MHTKPICSLTILFLAATAVLSAQQLHVYAIDVEGGKATLYVPSGGESLLIDTGYSGHENRDANRIAAAAKLAGVSRLDHVIITHYHGDHASGVPQLVATIPVGKFYDYGDAMGKDADTTKQFFLDYAAIRARYPHQTLHPGDTVPVKGLKVEVVAGAGRTIDKPLAGAGQPNPLCNSWEPLPPDPGENNYSLAMIITYGSLRISDLGDLHWDREHDLACPVNKLGTVDIYMTTHHGTMTSGSPQIVHALHPRVAIMNNGEVKGGSVKAWTAIHNSPGLEDLWQLHWSKEGAADHNVNEQFIANTSAEDDKGYALEIVAREDGSFTVRNQRNHTEKNYHR